MSWTVGLLWLGIIVVFIALFLLVTYVKVTKHRPRHKQNIKVNEESDTRTVG